MKENAQGEEQKDEVNGNEKDDGQKDDNNEDSNKRDKKKRERKEKKRGAKDGDEGEEKEGGRGRGRGRKGKAEPGTKQVWKAKNQDGDGKADEPKENADELQDQEESTPGDGKKQAESPGISEEALYAMSCLQ